MRNEDGWFDLADLREMFESLRLPQPGNLSATLGSLKNASLVVSRSKSKPWSLTPLGRDRAAGIVGAFSYDQIAAELAGTPGAEFAEGKHQVVPPAIAPVEWQSGINRLLQEFPFETNVFCMTRFPKATTAEMPDPVAQAITALRKVVAKHGLTLHLASDRQANDTIFGNVGAHMWACNYGIGLLEVLPESVETLNDNVLMELASMLMTGRRCAILKDRNAPSPPSDLTGHIYKSVSFGDLLSIEDQAHLWLAEDLQLGRCSDCPPSPTVTTELLEPSGR